MKDGQAEVPQGIFEQNHYLFFVADLMQNHHIVTVADLMFISKLAFLVTFFRGIMQITVEYLLDMKMNTLKMAAGGRADILQPWIHVTNALVDGQFNTLQGEIRVISMQEMSQRLIVP